MTKEAMAARLNGREIGDERDGGVGATAKDAGLVIVFGASDDLMELEGAINDEFGCFAGRTAMIDRVGLLGKRPDVDASDEELETWLARKKAAAQIKAIWCPKDDAGNIWTSWAYETDIPHATFDILDDGEIYCRGIVFELNALPVAP